METLVPFQLPMSPESEKHKSSLSSGQLGSGLKAAWFQFDLGKIKGVYLNNDRA